MLRTRFATQGKGILPQVLLHPDAPSRPRRRELWKAFTEDLATTPADATPEAARPQMHRDDRAATRQIGDRPRRATLQTPGAPSTARTPGALPGGRRRYVQRAPLPPRVINPHAGNLGKQ